MTHGARLILIFSSPRRGGAIAQCRCSKLPNREACAFKLNPQLCSAPRQWDEELTKVYFHRRYVYYVEYLLQELPHVIVWPTVDSLTATDLLKIRATRFQPCGVIFKPTYVDEARQSALNFLYPPDINHARRIHQNNKWYIRNLLLKSGACYPYEASELEDAAVVTRRNRRFCRRKTRYKSLLYLQT
mgnify:CR=1 FL=1